MKSIEIRNVHKGFEKEYGYKEVFKEYSLSIPYGDRLCFMGPSGSGKSTLLKLIMGIYRPDNGDIEGVPDKVAVVFQDDLLSEDYSVIVNAGMAAGSGITKAEIISMLERVGLSGEEHTPVRELSGGMKRRVAILRALLSDYELLILDEPFKGIDDETKESVADLIKEELNGKTLIMVAHDVRDAELLGAKIKELVTF